MNCLPEKSPMLRQCRTHLKDKYMSLNKAMLIGNVGKDPEIRYLEQNSPNSAKKATFTLATTERYRDRNGETRERTEWHNIVAWRNNADIVERFVRKGTQLYIEGKLRSSSWDGQDGVKHYTTEIYVDTLQLLGRRADNPGAYQGTASDMQSPARPAAAPGYAPSPSRGPAAGQSAEAIDIDIPGDDLPF